MVPDPSARQVFRRYLLVLIAPIAGILLALAVGVPPQRLRHAVEFQGIAVVAAVYFIVAIRMQRRTGRRQRRLESLMGMRFRTPIWMMLMECSIPIEIGAAVAAMVATFGFAGVGNGLFLTFVLIGLCMPLFRIGLQPRWIVVESDGLRMAISRATFLVPWAAVERIEPIGPDHFVGLNVILKDSEPVLDIGPTERPEGARPDKNADSSLAPERRWSVSHAVGGRVGWPNARTGNP